MLNFQSVSIERGGSLIWSQGSFEIPENQTTAVIGSNGSGKTTLIQILLGLLKPTTGEVTHDFERIGYVPQNYHLSFEQGLRGIDLVELGINGEKFGFITPKNKKLQKELIAKAIEATNSTPFAKKRFSSLSGGQQQRIAISSAIVNHPDLLILDEPLSSLDLNSAKELVALLSSLKKKHNLSIIVVAHDLALLLPILDGAIYLVDGHAHYSKLDDAEHKDYSDLLEHLKTMKVGEHEL